MDENKLVVQKLYEKRGKFGNPLEEPEAAEHSSAPAPEPSPAHEKEDRPPPSDESDDEAGQLTLSDSEAPHPRAPPKRVGRTYDGLLLPKFVLVSTRQGKSVARVQLNYLCRS